MIDDPTDYQSDVVPAIAILIFLALIIIPLVLYELSRAALRIRP